jgi:hypothetical protein
LQDNGNLLPGPAIPGFASHVRQVTLSAITVSQACSSSSSACSATQCSGAADGWQHKQQQQVALSAMTVRPGVQQQQQQRMQLQSQNLSAEVAAGQQLTQ